jgi:DNA-binding NtrC family response regulator
MRDQAVNPDLPAPKLILVIDDEEMITKILDKQLHRLGYSVLTDSSASAALKTVDSSGDQIELIILDYVMPEMNGLALASIIHQRHPELPILLNSGTLLAAGEIDAKKHGIVGIIQKPVSIEQLSAAVTAALSR